MTEEKNPKVLNDPLTHPARYVEEAESQIRLLVRNAFLKLQPSFRLSLNLAARRIISAAVKKIGSKSLKESAKVSLWNFYLSQVNEMRRIRETDRVIFLASLTLSERRSRPSQDDIDLPSLDQSVRIMRSRGFDVTNAGRSDIQINGVPAMQFQEEYFKKRVKPVFDDLLKQHPRDPDDLSGRNTLRNLAEMQVRYEDQQEQIQRMRDNGTRLVVSSSHSDASDRCRPWQNRVYSLDGTSGIAPDGRRFVPLETATNVPYRTRSGKVYMNGLLGFNCRHYLVPYKDGLRFTRQDDAEEIKQYKITVRQRQMERTIRAYETRAMMSANGIDPKENLLARRKVAQWTQAYKDFSEANGRAWYRSRIKLL